MLWWSCCGNTITVSPWLLVAESILYVHIRPSEEQTLRLLYKGSCRGTWTDPCSCPESRQKILPCSGAGAFWPVYGSTVHEILLIIRAGVVPQVQGLATVTDVFVFGANPWFDLCEALLCWL